MPPWTVMSTQNDRVSRVQNVEDPGEWLEAALTQQDPSKRLQAVLAAGSDPNPAYIRLLVARCAIEPDFYVRDMLTWAMLQHERTTVTQHVLSELHAENPQARSQALHTLSKINDASTWSAIAEGHLQDADDEVAKAAWRAAAGLVPEAQKTQLANTLATQFGRGDHALQLSLSRAFVELGETVLPVVVEAKAHPDESVRVHATSTERLMADPQEGCRSAGRSEMQIIEVSTVVLQKADGAILTVRKKGTDRFMLPGGKPEPGESPEETAIRECREEIGVDLSLDDLRLVGVFRAAAANEPGVDVVATLFEHPAPTDVVRSGEIDELRWFDPADLPLPTDLAPLITTHVLPLLAGS